MECINYKLNLRIEYILSTVLYYMITLFKLIINFFLTLIFLIILLLHLYYIHHDTSTQFKIYIYIHHQIITAILNHNTHILCYLFTLMINNLNLFYS